MRKILFGLAALVAVAAVCLGVVVGPKVKRFMAHSTKELDSQLKIFIGAGGNSVVFRSKDNRQVLMIDTKMGGGTDRIKDYINEVAPEANITIVNTHYHSDHTKGNAQFPEAYVIAGDYADDFWTREAGVPLPQEKIAVNALKVLTMDDETIRIINMGQAHTRNDVVVYFEKRKLLVTGDLLFWRWHPALFAKSGSNIGKWVGALDRLLSEFEPVYVLPGHGSMTDQKGLLAMKDYFTTIRDARDNPKALESLKKKYADYFSIPGMSGFDKTLAFIQAESE